MTETVLKIANVKELIAKVDVQGNKNGKIDTKEEKILFSSEVKAVIDEYNAEIDKVGGVTNGKTMKQKMRKVSKKI